jgi:NRPS condensation-like uncharacterized protein
MAGVIGKPKKIKAEAFDVMQYLYSTVHEPLIHCVISLTGHVDEIILKKAVDLSFSVVPLIRCCFRTAGIHPFWEEEEFTALDIVHVITAETDPEVQKQRLLSSIINPACEPQLKIYILREQDKDTLLIIINHMVCDGAGFKEYLYLLCALYTSCMNPTDVEPKLETARRDALQLMTNYSLREKMQVWFLPNDNSTLRQEMMFSLQGDPGNPFFVTVPIGNEDFFHIKDHAKRLGATVNDMILAAYIRVLAKQLRTNHIQIPCPVDLRKYIPAGWKYGISNLTSNFTCNVIIETDEAFETTVFKVNEQIKRQKNGIQWLKGIMMLEFFYHRLPFFMFKKLFQQVFTIPVISFTNLGVIDSNRLRFGILPVNDAYLTGAVKYVPYFQIAVSTYNDCCTLSSNLYGTPEDIITVKKFLVKVKEELLNNEKV